MGGTIGRVSDSEKGKGSVPIDSVWVLLDYTNLLIVAERMSKETTESPLYTAPPIMEAVIQFTFASPLPLAAHRKLAKRLKREYGNETPTESVEAKIDFSHRNVEFTSQPQNRLSSADETDVLVLHPHTMIWSRLAPYQGWQPFVERVQRDISIAQDITGPRKIGRLGIRYINRLHVPRHGDETRYEEYLTINIDLPEKWRVIQNYAWRFEREFPNFNARAIVQSAITESDLPNCGAFLLDIDIISQHEIPNKIDDIFNKLSEMRDLKNEIFETSVSDKARESFSL